MFSQKRKKRERQEAWMRLVVLVVTGIIVGVWAYLTYALMIIHWLIMVFSGRRNKDLADFIEYWNIAFRKFFFASFNVDNIIAVVINIDIFVNTWDKHCIIKSCSAITKFRFNFMY